VINYKFALYLNRPQMTAADRNELANVDPQQSSAVIKASNILSLANRPTKPTSQTSNLEAQNAKERILV
ncbi:hypothetical protein, partial [Halomonas halmophila]|uniref:hypothetical protein n=1 Tax=Halomonas halmophila TaxID=252 RepID=UPI001C3F9C0C